MNNISALARTITTLVGVTNTMSGCHQSVKRVDGDPEANMMVFRSLYAPMDAARIIVDKLAEYSAMANSQII